MNNTNFVNSYFIKEKKMIKKILSKFLKFDFRIQIFMIDMIDMIIIYCICIEKKIKCSINASLNLDELIYQIFCNLNHVIYHGYYNLGFEISYIIILPL